MRSGGHSETIPVSRSSQNQAVEASVGESWSPTPHSNPVPLRNCSQGQQQHVLRGCGSERGGNEVGQMLPTPEEKTRCARRAVSRLEAGERSCVFSYLSPLGGVVHNAKRCSKAHPVPGVCKATGGMDGPPHALPPSPTLQRQDAEHR